MFPELYRLIFIDRTRQALYKTNSNIKKERAAFLIGVKKFDYFTTQRLYDFFYGINNLN
jgi:hypothetical protein